MKAIFKLLPALIIPVLLISACDRGSGNLALVRTIPGGCAAKTADKGINTADSQGVTCTIEDRNLNIKVGFFGGCCVPYSPSYKIEADTVLLKLDSDISNGYCNCICFYSYTYVFKGLWTNLYYNVLIDGFSIFKGKINP
jgi:hypothetical protein